jgi:hypothetical protein
MVKKNIMNNNKSKKYGMVWWTFVPWNQSFCQYYEKLESICGGQSGFAPNS